MTHEYPQEWSKASVEVVCDILDSKRVPLNSDQRRDKKGSIPYWGANGVVDYIDEYIFDEPLLLMAEDGGYFNEARTRPICHLLDGKSWVNNHAHVMRVKGGTLREWVYYWFVHRNITPFINGGTRSKLNQGDLRQLPIYVPPLPEQKKIAEVLSSVDEAIAATKAVIDQTKQVKKGLLQTLLTKGIGHTKFKQTELGEIPESWEVKRLNECGIAVIDGDRGKAYPKAAEFLDEGYCLFLSAKNITKNGFRWNEKQFIGEERHNLLRKGVLERNDIVLTTRGTVGNIGYFDQSVPYDVVRINSGMVILRNNAKQLSTDLVHIVLDSPIIRKQIDQLAFGSAQPQLTVKVINNLFVPVPSFEEQPKMIDILQNSSSALAANETKLSQLQTLKSGLMSDLLTGRKRVEMS